MGPAGVRKGAWRRPGGWGTEGLEGVGGAFRGWGEPFNLKPYLTCLLRATFPAITMGRLAALVALALLVSVGVGPAAAVQPLGEDNLEQLLVHGTQRAVRVKTLKAMQRAYGGGLGWISWPEMEVIETFVCAAARLCSTFMETKIIQALMKVMKQDRGATRLLNQKAGLPCNSEKGSETLATFVGAVIFLRAFFVHYPGVRVVLDGGVLHQYCHATRQLVPVSEEEQFKFEKQRAARWVAQKWETVVVEEGEETEEEEEEEGED